MKFGRIKFLVVGLIALILLALGSFRLAKQFVKDQVQSGMNFDRPSQILTRVQTNNGTTRTTKTYNQKELEQMRKRGQLPTGLKQVYTPNVNSAGEAAVQRSMKTLEEINRINQMNQQMLDQQRRNQGKN